MVVIVLTRPKLVSVGHNFISLAGDPLLIPRRRRALRGVDIASL